MVGDIPMKEAIRIALLDDHQLFREGLARLLAAEPGFIVVGHFSTIDEALSAMARETLDIILLDYDLGAEVATNFLACVSVLKPTPRILMVTAGMTEEARREALAVGVLDIVLKHSRPRVLIDAIRRAAQAKPTPDLESLIRAQSLGAREERGVTVQERPLTRRQSRALRGILDGLANKEIAEKMDISVSSVKAIVQELFYKAGVRTRSQLVRVTFEKHSSDWIGKNN
jgi:two-component system, NarL family, nitrate/nitrite response regulator NarL